MPNCQITIFKLLEENIGECARRPAHLSLASVFGRNRPRDAPSTGLRQPSNLCFHLQPSGPSFCPPSASGNIPRFVRIIPPRWRPPSTSGSTCICRPPTPTSPWASTRCLSRRALSVS
ncbi:Hypothetical predicted protein [Lynx pardinus]|uniref:Uncharacterized protein n=1 Tax=Lynx pardinus TaxID=191816 RepID=A0A485NK88_LYNPA|nr:Hypothetical predicted protein [Lynx pardinus]